MKIKPSGRAGFTLTEVMIVAGIIGLLAEIAIPSYLASRDQGIRQNCISNLRQIDSAKQQWALEELRAPTAVPRPDELAPFFGHGGGDEPDVHCPRDQRKSYDTSYDTLDLIVPPECKQLPNEHVLL